MFKKTRTISKLTLSAETIANLSTADLRQAAGGADGLATLACGITKALTCTCPTMWCKIG